MNNEGRSKLLISGKNISAARIGALYLLVTVYCLGTPANAESPFKNMGPGTGGGGGVVVCLSPKQEVRSVELVDIVESRFYDKTAPSPGLTRLPWEAQVKEAVNRIAFVDPQLHAMLWERVQTVKREFESSMNETRDTDLTFPAPQDLSHGRVPPLRLGCQVAGLAVFNDASPAGERLKISHFLWKRLSATHKAALLLHESIYLMHRDIYRNLTIPEMPDSSATRALVGFLFSSELEKNSKTKEERERFLRPGAYRGYELPLGEVDPRSSFRDKLQYLLKPLLPYFVKKVERPLFLDGSTCRGGNYLVKVADTDPSLVCEMSAVAHRGIGVFQARALDRLSAEKKGISLYRYSPHPGKYLEDLLLTCHSHSALHPRNPGFQIYCGETEIAKISPSTTQEPVGLSLKNKRDFENTFVRDLVFE